MEPNLVFYHLLLVALVFICLMLDVWWPNTPRVAAQRPRKPDKPCRQRSTEPNPFTGYLHKPLCEACEQEAETRLKAPGTPPPRLIFARGRHRTSDTQQFCPDQECSSFGGFGYGAIHSNEHPGGQSWLQLPCVSCHDSFYETRGTLFHDKRTSTHLIRGGVACLAEGLGLRGTERFFEIASNTVRRWWIEAADQRQVFSADFLYDVHVNHAQGDALYAVLSAGRDDAFSETGAIERL